MVTDAIKYRVPSFVCQACDYDPFSHIDLASWNFCLSTLEHTMSAFQAHRTQQLKTQKSLIQELDSKTMECATPCVNTSNRSGDTILRKSTSFTSSLFLPLSNASDCNMNSAVLHSEEGRNFLDAIKDSLSETNTSHESDASDSECMETDQEVDGPPPTKKVKLEESGANSTSTSTVVDIPDKTSGMKYGRRILDEFMISESECTAYSLVRVFIKLLIFYDMTYFYFLF